MTDLPVYQLLKDAAIKWPAKPAIYDEHGMITFEELYLQSETLRKKLIELGVKRGMGIGVKANNSRSFITGLFGAVGTGAAVMPMSHQLKKAEIEEILKDARLHVLIDDMSGIPPILPVKEKIGLKDLTFSFSYTNLDSAIPFAPHVKDPAFMRFTSGTTGRSKGVIVSHRSVIERIEAANIALQLGTGDTVVWVLPMAYHFIVSVVLYVRFGATIAIAKDFLAKSIIDITNEHKCTLLYASPMHIRLLANDTGTGELPSLKKAISTSAAISLDICKAFKRRFGIDVSQAYGIIEIGLPMINFVKSEEHPEAVGYAIPGYTVDILDENYVPLPAGHVGQLAIKGPGMFDAYLVPPMEREEILKNGYFLTADYAVKSIDGLITIQGRSMSVINVSGMKVFPEEVEALLEMIPGIKHARISGSPHPMIGQVIEGEVVLQEGETIDIEKVLSYCRQRLSAFKAPQRLTIVESLPMTKTGKLIR
ncbi:MAG: AMP-binding protein [Ferruginibacter sp.]